MCLWHPSQPTNPEFCAAREGREKRWPNTEDIIIEIERIITKIEEVEIERMPVDTNKNRHQKSKKRRSNSYSFYWWYARLLKFSDSFKIPIDINNVKDNSLLLQKGQRQRCKKGNHWNQLITDKSKSKQTFYGSR